MTKHEKAKQVLEAFIESYSMEGACGAFFVDPEMDVHSNYNIHVVFNIDWIKNQEARPHLVAKKLRDNFKQEIKNYTGIDVYVSSSSTNCNNLEKLSESMAPHVKRRLSNVKILDELTTILDYEINIENFDNASDAVEELCDMLNERILDEIWETTHRKVSLAEKDELYWHIHNRFNKFITHRYNESKEMNESVVYDYKENRNESTERLPFDVNKLIDAGAVFVTPAIDGDPNSKHYKKFLNRRHTHLITLYNLKHTTPDSWIHKAVTRFASPKHWDNKDFANNLYDGKYNQILWSLDKLNIPYKSMLIDNMNESKKKYIVKESQLERIKEYFDPIHYLKKIVTNAPKYIRDPESLKYDVGFQKIVDVIFKYTMKHKPVDNLKGLEITKVTPQGWGSDIRDDSKGSHTEWTILLSPKLPKWFNPDDIDYRTQLEDFKKEFASIAHMMGLSSSSPMSQEGYPKDKVKFIINSN